MKNLHYSIIIAFSSIFWLNGSSSQGVFITTGNHFNPDTGELTLESVISQGTGSSDSIQYKNLNFQLEHDGRFVVKSAESPSPEQECTKEEVLNAIPLLTLNLNIEQAEQLVGCYARLTSGPVDLDKGKQITAAWYGANGRENQAPGNLFDSSRGFPVSNGPIARGPGLLVITMTFEEGVMKNYSFSGHSKYYLCSPSLDFASKIETLEVGQTYVEVAAILGCEGNVSNTTVSVDGVRENYSWDLGSSTWLYGDERDRDPQHISMSFKDGFSGPFLFQESKSSRQAENCSAGELEDLFDSIAENMTIEEIINAIPCPVVSEHTTIENGFSKKSFRWSSDHERQSIFFSPNRTLSVGLEDGFVTSIELLRR